MVVNYDETVKALIFVMKNYLNVPEAKISEFLEMVTNKALKISRGMINNINKEFAEKSEEEQKGAYERIFQFPAMSTDMTTACMNGLLKNILVCTNGVDFLYYFTDTKGDKAVEGTVLEKYPNTLIHDHAMLWYHCGSAHRECNEHHLCYLKGAMENEPNLTWDGKMRALLQEIDHVWKEQGRQVSAGQAREFREQYEDILDLADQECKENPPSKYYRKGINFSVELRKFEDQVLGFLKDVTVDFTNNVAERCLRKAKRHMAVSGTLRGKTNHSGEEYCQALGVVETERHSGHGIWEVVKGIFKRPRGAKTPHALPQP